MVEIYPGTPVRQPFRYHVMALIAMSFAFYVDAKYLGMAKRENDQFVERSRCYADWRTRNKVLPLASDPEHLKE